MLVSAPSSVDGSVPVSWLVKSNLKPRARTTVVALIYRYYGIRRPHRALPCAAAKDAAACALNPACRAVVCLFWHYMMETMVPYNGGRR
jgi:hypothetical protein